MGIFSRSSRTPSSSDSSASVDAAATPAEQADPAADAAPAVGISVSSFRGVGEAAGPAPVEDAEAPAPAPSARTPRTRTTVPGVTDNALLTAALLALPPQASPQERLNVVRQMLQGHLYLRVRGDARSLLAAGENLPMTVATSGDEQYLLAYSGGEPLQEAVRSDGDTETSAVAVPVAQVLQQALAGPFTGLVIDHASGDASVILPRTLLERALDDLDETTAVKSALIGERTPEAIAALVEAMRGAPLWIAARQGEDGQIGVAEARMSDGRRMLEVYSHPLELHVLGRGDAAAKVTAEQLGLALASDPELAGVVVNPQGPWMQLSRADLAPLLP
ncbi:SseB family protein [Microbacterium sp. SORGH_AS_0888]|uniref:SseB family protein n=1 Tax=Microbacterium sp. SORGH_AS_0888 TaxID=3041791 RepID=UPI00278356A8|nr:SseB family protein [Microbacterium sp. SORGH_AS_0888]MDQ1131242.1 hypothetical protein [Microbacterium sp. SORGH_AS_0888]